MAGGVELVHRTDQPHPERRLDLGSLADLQEPVETLEHLHIIPPRRRRPTRRWPAHPPPGRRPRRSPPTPGAPAPPASAPARRRRCRSSTRLNPRAVHDATNASTHSAWNCCGSARHQRPARPARDHPQPAVAHPHTFFAPEVSRQHLNSRAYTLKISDTPIDGKTSGSRPNPAERTCARSISLAGLHPDAQHVFDAVRCRCRPQCGRPC